MNKNAVIELNSWFAKPSDFLLISGPCSAESEGQVLATAKELKKLSCPLVFRSGLWKPRTNPNSFEGVGEKGLVWLQKVKEQFAFPVATEIAIPQHVDICLKNDIDMLWLGARTVANPFSVQEIAEALKGVNIPIFIKNPIHPDIDLWLGALERIRKSGIRKIAAIHRGFYYFQKSEYRNAPMWEIPLELKRIMPDLPLICDPSHISGNTAFIERFSQKAVNLGMNGLMIESHINPKNALSDASQQITPNQLVKVLNNLDLKSEKGDIAFENQLESLRTEIDKLDAELINILSKRMDVVNDIGQYKKQNHITIFQLERWNQILKDRLSRADENNLTKKFIKDLLNIVHMESIRRQEEIKKR